MTFIFFATSSVAIHCVTFADFRKSCLYNLLLCGRGVLHLILSVVSGKVYVIHTLVSENLVSGKVYVIHTLVSGNLVSGKVYVITPPVPANSKATDSAYKNLIIKNSILYNKSKRPIIYRTI